MGLYGNAHAREAPGAWTLRVNDSVGGDTGTLDSWSMRFRAVALSGGEDRDGEDRDTHFLAVFHSPDVMELLNWM